MDTITSTLCAALGPDPAPQLWQALPADGWPLLVQAAREHGVAGLLLRALRRSIWLDQLPAPALAALRSHAHADAGHNMRAYRALADALALLDPATPVVALKGAALGPWLYPAPALRPLSDVDLLVPAHAVEPIAAALTSLGYRPKHSIAPELIQSLDPHLTLLHPRGGVTIELHWALTSGSADWRAAPIAWFWQRTEPWCPPAGQAPGPALRLDATASLLYQCAHLVLRHGQDPARLIWVYDLHLLATSGQVHWDVFTAQAHALGWAAAARIALHEARRCFATPLPPALLDGLQGPSDPRLRFYGVGASGRPYTTWDALAELDFPTKTRLFARVVLPSRAYLREQYQPRWGRWWPLAYPYRWFLPLGRLARRTIRR